MPGRSNRSKRKRSITNTAVSTRATRRTRRTSPSTGTQGNREDKSKGQEKNQAENARDEGTIHLEEDNGTKRADAVEDNEEVEVGANRSEQERQHELEKRASDPYQEEEDEEQEEQHQEGTEEEDHRTGKLQATIRAKPTSKTPSGTSNREAVPSSSTYSQQRLEAATQAETSGSSSKTPTVFGAMTDGGPFYLGPPRFLRNKNNTSAEDDDIDMDMDHEGSHSSGSRGKGKAKRKLRVRSTSERLRRERRKAKAPVSRPSKEERERDVIGVLEGKYKSRILTIDVNLKEVVKIGRFWPNHIRMVEKPISRYHLRMYATRTHSRLSLPVLFDVSSNGIIINGTHRVPGEGVHIKKKFVTTRSVILLDGDTVAFPGLDSVTFTYRHNHERHGAVPESQEDNRPRGLFDNHTDTTDTRQVGHYTVQNVLLGAGSYGLVYLAKKVHQQVAIKLLRNEPVSVIKKKHTEIEMMTRLDHHPNIQQMFDTFPDTRRNVTSCSYIVLELVTGGDLFEYVVRYGALKEGEMRFFVWQLLKAIQHIHGSEAAHRDLKPENILLYNTSYFPRLIVSDLGDCTTRDLLLDLVPKEAGKVIRPCYPFGTINYLPPEALQAAIDNKESRVYKSSGTIYSRKRIADDWLEADKACDIWALGCIIWQCIANNYPFRYSEILALSKTSHPDGEEDDDASDSAISRSTSVKLEDLTLNQLRLNTTFDGVEGDQEMRDAQGSRYQLFDDEDESMDVDGYQPDQMDQDVQEGEWMDVDQDEDLNERQLSIKDEWITPSTQNRAKQQGNGAIGDNHGSEDGHHDDAYGPNGTQDVEKAQAARDLLSMAGGNRHVSTAPSRSSTQWEHELALEEAQDEDYLDVLQLEELEGRALEEGEVDRRRRYLTLIESYADDRNLKWDEEPDEVWAGYEESVKVMIDQALVIDSEGRATVEQLIDHPWLQDHKAELQALYEKVVIQGKLWDM